MNILFPQQYTRSVSKDLERKAVVDGECKLKHSSARDTMPLQDIPRHENKGLTEKKPCQKEIMIEKSSRNTRLK